MNTLCFELCVESVEAACAAEAGGAHRIELCGTLSDGGTTPCFDLMQATVNAISIPVSVLIRPRHGGFVYSDQELERMRQQIGEAKCAGAASVVVGVLLGDGRVDVARTRELVELAQPMRATFHRAFDQTPDLDEALGDVIATGARCLLTSGGKPDVLAGADAIGSIRVRAAGRIEVMAGGGLRIGNLAEVVRRSGVSCLHSSLTGNGAKAAALEGDLRAAIRLFHEVWNNGVASPA